MTNQPEGPSLDSLSRRATAQVAPAFLVVLAFCVVAAPAFAQTTEIDDAWTEYEDAEAAYTDAVSECDERGVGTTSGDRACRAAVTAGSRLVRALDVLLSADPDLEGEEREVAIDARMTYAQHVGTLLVDLDECERAITVFESLLENRHVATRPLLRDAITTSLGEARECANPPAEPEPPVATPGETPPDALRWPGWVVAGAGAVMVATGIGVVSGPFDAANDEIRCWNAADCDPDVSASGIERTRDRRTRLNRTASSLLWIGGAATVSGLVWAFLPRDSHRDADLAFGVAPAPGSVAAHLDVRF